MVGVANYGPNTNGSQFFFTLDRADELNGKNTIFGKVYFNNVVIFRKWLNVSQSSKGVLKIMVFSNSFNEHNQVTGNTIYNLLKIAEVETDDNDCPLYPLKIIKTEVWF